MGILSHYKTWKQTTYKRRLWNIGFVAFDDRTIHEPLEIAWLEHDEKDGWFADPFIIGDDGDRLDVLVEYFRYADGRGHIAKLIVRRAQGRYRLERIVPIIRDGTHFSFPNVWREGDQLFIFPENWESGTLPMYAYDPNTGEAEPGGPLYSAPLVDAVLTEAFGQPRLFATRETNDPSGCELEVFVADGMNWRGPYRKESTCVFDNRVARGGGQFFWIGDRLIRVAQDNNGVYGGGLVFFETHYDNGSFSFTEVARHLPGNGRYNLGLHTFNVHGNVAAVDGRGYAHPWRRTVKRFKRMLGKKKRIGDPWRATAVGLAT